MRATPLAVVALTLAACSTETRERGLMGEWKRSESSSSRDEPPPARREPPQEADRGTRVDIGPEVAAQMKEFANRRSTIYGDVVEIEASREAWFGLASITYSRDAVRRADLEDAAQGALTIMLIRLPEVPATKETVPTVHFGDGLTIVGVEKITIRFSSINSVERPFWFHAVATGKRAVYAVESEPPQEWRGTTVHVRNEVRHAASGWRFDWSAEASP